ncbi:unnamed protein product [Lactuca virosa]|uniref:Reticulon-like protein n=1 Tax=Lactuca virosa TaxID=75947 RepID=A0AAU9MQ48_9ASTR|nr:unnamed protein product [Lactuca virosa]
MSMAVDLVNVINFLVALFFTIGCVNLYVLVLSVVPSFLKSRIPSRSLQKDGQLSAVVQLLNLKNLHSPSNLLPHTLQPLKVHALKVIICVLLSGARYPKVSCLNEKKGFFEICSK